MPFNHVTSVDYKTNAGTVSAARTIASGSIGDQLIDESIAAGASNVNFAISLTVSQLVSLLMYSSKPITIKTNSSSTPAQTFTLAAGGAITWNSSRSAPNPLTVNVTAFYFSNFGTEPAQVKFRFLSN